MEDTMNTQTEEMTAEQEGLFDSAFDGADDEAVEETPQGEADEPKEPQQEAQEEKGEPERAEPAREAPQPEKSLDRQAIEKLARASNMSVEEFLDNADTLAEQAAQTHREEKVGQRVAQLLEQGMEEPLARRFAEVEYENAKLREQEQAARQSGEQLKSQQAALQRDLNRLVEQYPDAPTTEPPKEVVALVEQGMTPLEAWQKHELEVLRKEAAQLRQDKKNREKSPGSVKGGRVNAEDDFTRALMGDYD